MNVKMIREMAFDCYTGKHHEFDEILFAKLLVQECLKLSSDLNAFTAIDASGADYGSAELYRVFDNTKNQYYDAIVKHFGIDE